MFVSIKNLMTETPTSYSLLVMYKDVIYAVRDPYGNRPLSIGRLVPISKLHSSGVCRPKELFSVREKVGGEDISVSALNLGCKYYYAFGNVTCATTIFPYSE